MGTGLASCGGDRSGGHRAITPGGDGDEPGFCGAKAPVPGRKPLCRARSDPPIQLSSFAAPRRVQGRRAGSPHPPDTRTWASNLFFDVRIADALAGVPTAGVGWIPGPGADIVLAIGGSVDGWTSFGPNNPTPGAAFERVFVSYDTPLATDGSLRVEADLGGATGTALLVPEPATALSLGAALVALAAARRRRGRAAPSTRKPSRC